MQIYSKISQLPHGRASAHISPGCLVLEGGAFRGIYTSGAIDALMQADINLESTLGVSAGALNGLCYVSGQIGRAGRMNLYYRHDDRNLGMKGLLQHRSVIDFDYLFGEVSKREPLDMDILNAPYHRFFAAATNCLSGEMTIFENGKCGDILKCVSASCSMPYFCHVVEIDGVPYLDGGCSSKIPFRWALDQGYEKIVVIRTKHRSYRKRETWLSRHAPDMFYRRYPQLSERLRQMNAQYNEDCETLEKLHQSGRLFMIAPSRRVRVKRLEANVEKLVDFYHLGASDVAAKLDALRDYLTD